jgi:tRNA(Ile)-lysidine synthetase-like protein
MDGLPGATPLPEGVRALAAVSGGPDSTALLVWLRESGVDVAAAHYDHALRPGSAADGERVAELCAGLGVPLVRERRTGPVPRGSLQAAARAFRYAFLERALAATGRDVVCLGHIADDVVEGAALHLLRGSGLAGLRGMPRTRGPFVRPLLDVWRADVEAYLAARELEPARDPSNGDTDHFARARVRFQLLPALERDRPGLTRRLHGAAVAAAGLQARLEAEAAVLVAAGARRADLRRAPRVVRLEAYRQLYGRLPALDRRLLEAMDRLALEGRTGAGIDLPRGLRFTVQPDGVSICMAMLPPPCAPRLTVRSCAGCGDGFAAHLRPGPTLTVGFRRPGLRMRPVGAPGTRKLQDILTDARVPRHLRDRLPLVFADGRLAWVPGIALDVDAAAPAGTPAWHVTLPGVPTKSRGSTLLAPLGVPGGGGNLESQVVVSTSATPRSPVI